MTSDDSKAPPENASTPDASTADSLVGTVLGGRYRVDALIGKGGMGSVYLGYQMELERKVAIKVILEDLARNSTVVERFRREAAATARLRHPNIVTVYDFAMSRGDRMYLVMEYLGGPNLEDWLAKRGIPSAQEGIDVLKPGCKAIHSLHVAGVIHRDIKPSNIILPDPEAPDDLVKVVDFGIARLRDAGGAKLTGKAILGSPGYLAPEVIEGDDATVASDIYALGILSFSVLTGKLPFAGATQGAVLMQHLTKTPPAPSSVNENLPKDVDAVILRALEKAPSARQASADEFVTQLAEAIERDPGVKAPKTLRPSPELVPVLAGARESSEVVHVLVIDDEEDIRVVTRATLERAGYLVETAADGIDALMRIGADRFDLILSDVDMPNLDGFTLLESLAKKGFQTPVIFITGRVDAENEVRGLELGAEDYLRKPVMPAVLLARVKTALSKRR